MLTIKLLLLFFLIFVAKVVSGSSDENSDGSDDVDVESINQQDKNGFYALSFLCSDMDDSSSDSIESDDEYYVGGGSGSANDSGHPCRRRNKLMTAKQYQVIKKAKTANCAPVEENNECVICLDISTAPVITLPSSLIKGKRAPRPSELIGSFSRSNAHSRRIRCFFSENKSTAANFRCSGQTLIEKGCGNIYHEGCLVQLALSSGAKLKCPHCRSEKPEFLTLEEAMFRMPENLLRNAISNSSFSTFKPILKWLKYYHWSDRHHSEGAWWTILSFLLESFHSVRRVEFNNNYSVLLESFTLLSDIGNDDVLLQFMKGLNFVNEKKLHRFLVDALTNQVCYRRVLDLSILIKEEIWPSLSRTPAILDHLFQIHQGNLIFAAPRRREISLFFELPFADSSISIIKRILNVFPLSKFTFVRAEGNFDKLFQLTSNTECAANNCYNGVLFNLKELRLEPQPAMSGMYKLKSYRKDVDLFSKIDSGRNINLLIRESFIVGKGKLAKLAKFINAWHYKIVV